MHLTQVLHQNLQCRPEQTATRFGNRTQSWASLENRVARLAAGLRSHGLESSDRVAILAHNSDYYLECLFATQWAGGVIVPVNTRWSAPEISHVLEDCKPAFLAIDSQFSAMAADFCRNVPQAPARLYLGDDTAPDGCIGWEAGMLADQPVADLRTADKTLASIMYTGGTTGRSKGVMMSHGAQVMHSTSLVATAGIPGEVTYLHTAPMFHVADAMFLHAVSLVGGTHVILSGFDPKSVCETIERHGVTDTILVPTMISMLMDFPDIGKYNLGSLKRLFYGASPMPEALMRRVLKALPDCQPIQLYGQTEAAPVLTVLEGRYHCMEGPFAGKLKSAGRAMYNVELKIVDEAGHEAPYGIAGEVVARAPHVMQGYWNMTDQTAETLRNGWLHTGDVAIMDEDGFITICDRLKDMIISGGENVYTTEVENALYTHPAVQSCTVIGLPDDRWGERVHAIVILKQGESTTEDDLIRHCKSLIAGYKCPRAISFRTTPMPVSGAGKILKTTLRDEYSKA